jgi:hypothetical protein
MPPEPFAHLLQRLATKFASQSAFAAAIGVDRSRLSRAINGDPVMFDVLRCFHLARATGEDIYVVLRAAGKSELADIMEELVGPAKSPRTIAIDRAIARLEPLLQSHVVSLVMDIAQGPPVPPARTFPRKVAKSRRRGAA